MGQTSIEWTDRTWNPVRGCSRVSEGCRNCYAERQAARFSKPSPGPDLMGLPRAGGPFAGFVRITNGHPQWTGRVELVEKHLTDPLHWRKPQRVFFNSMSDLFHEALPYEAIDRIFAVMSVCPQHTFQVLTKRPERMLKWFRRGDRYETSALVAWQAETLKSHRKLGATWPLPNVWLGVSVEDQKTADERIPLLLQTPAAVRFVSYEPALESVEFYQYLAYGQELSWIIVGGESGPDARPFDIAWARQTIAQCKGAGVPCFVKQLGTNPLEENDATGPYPAFHHELKLKDRKGGDMNEWPEDLRVRQFPNTLSTAMQDVDEDAERYLRGEVNL